ncbi:MAG TPA: HAMP domain-containing sensor histidine kinase [Gemmatimonadaceae bacterium]
MRLGRRPALLVLLLLALFGLSALLAHEAWASGRKRRALADQAMRQYASFAAAKYRDNVQAWLYTALDALFATTWASLEERRADPAVGVGAGALARSARAFAGCACGPRIRALYYFEVPLGGIGGPPVAITPADTTPGEAERRWVADTVTAHARLFIANRKNTESRFGALASSHPYATIYGEFAGRLTVLIYTLRRDPAGRAVGAYGLLTDASRFVSPIFPPLFRDRIVLPPLLHGWEPNDSLFSVMVGDSLGRIYYRSPVQYVSSLGAEVRLDPPLGHLRVSFAVRPAVERAILVGGLPQTRVPMLLGALAGTAALIVVTLLQLRAEHEFARQRADFAASVSHDLRTPLAQILLFAETVKLGRATSEQRRAKAVDVIVREAHRLMALVDNVLHVTRAERGLTRVSLEWIVAAHLVAETVEEFAPLAREAGSEIALEPADANILANADPASVRQMLINVLDNAVKYGRHGQTIRVGVAYAGEAAQLWVDDEGPGVAPADRERIWKPFVRLARAAGPDVAGAGIGLAVVRELATTQRGRAWVEQGTRGGARFVIALPGALAEVDPDAPTVPGAAADADA